MGKREIGQAPGGDTEAPRAKRRKSADSKAVVVGNSDAISDGEGKVEGYGGGDVREQGLILWQTVKDAVNKDGRVLSIDFQRKPPKKLYPDYYQIIYEPIALDDIKKKLDNNAYLDLEAVRQDFELCFNNAKKYNVKDSVIWKDAKDLLKLANRTYAKLIPSEDGAALEAKKTPNLTRLLKFRLEKLIDKKDDNGQPLSTEFMELPSKRLWPFYYQTIKHPQCLENIYKRVKRKEYSTPEDFANDVELVFSNALTFNQDHTPIWEAAVSLRDTFRQLMSDLPAPYTMSRYTSQAAKQSTAKIRIKMPGAVASAPHVEEDACKPHGPSKILLRVPAHKPEIHEERTVVDVSAPSPPTQEAQNLVQEVAAAAQALSKATKSESVTDVPSGLVSTLRAEAAVQPFATTEPVVATRTVEPAPALPSVITAHKRQARSRQPTPQAKAKTTKQPAPVHTAPVHYPSHPAPYQVYAPAPTYHTPAPVPQQPPVASTSTAYTQNETPSESPAPPELDVYHQLKSVCICTEPRGRQLKLDFEAGVKTWVLQLGPRENSLSIFGVTYQTANNGDISLDEDGDEEEEGGEEGPAKKKQRGRPSKAAMLARQKAELAKARRARLVKDIDVTVNGVAIKDKSTSDNTVDDNVKMTKHSRLLDKEWSVGLVGGVNVVEIGEKNGMIWRLHVYRPTH